MSGVPDDRIERDRVRLVREVNASAYGGSRRWGDRHARLKRSQEDARCDQSRERSGSCWRPSLKRSRRMASRDYRRCARSHEAHEDEGTLDRRARLACTELRTNFARPPMTTSGPAAGHARRSTVEVALTGEKNERHGGKILDMRSVLAMFWKCTLSGTTPSRSTQG
jgi:hypothetical protein